MGGNRAAPGAVGVHSGETENRDGDYFGPAMNRTAGIMAAGHGGQVLLPLAVAAELARPAPPRAARRDLGIHRLKDLTLSEHLYQLVHDDLQSDPAPRTLDSDPTTSPSTTEFLGRASELAAIGVMLESSSIRLLTIAGPGGAGKTRLGLQVAAEQWTVSVTASSSSTSPLSGIRMPLEAIVQGAGASGGVAEAAIPSRS